MLNLGRMKKDEPYNASLKSETAPERLYFRPANRKDRDAISSLVSDGNPAQELSEIYKMTNF